MIEYGKDNAIKKFARGQYTGSIFSGVPYLTHNLHYYVNDPSSSTTDNTNNKVTKTSKKSCQGNFKSTSYRLLNSCVDGVIYTCTLYINVKYTHFKRASKGLSKQLSGGFVGKFCHYVIRYSFSV